MIDGMVRLTVFMVCARMLVCFRPKDGYEKYLRLLVRLLVLLQFLLFVGGLFEKGSEEDILSQLKQLQGKMATDLGQIRPGQDWEQDAEEGEWESNIATGRNEASGLKDSEITVSDIQIGQVVVEDVTVSMGGEYEP